MAEAGVQGEVRRALGLLRRLMREQGFTQLQVQDRLQWGRTAISQLMTEQKRLRFDQILAILEVIGVPRDRFFAELFPAAGRSAAGASLGTSRAALGQ